jgi:hypothetical protein
MQPEDKPVERIGERQNEGNRDLRQGAKAFRRPKSGGEIHAAGIPGIAPYNAARREHEAA